MERAERDETATRFNFDVTVQVTVKIPVPIIGVENQAEASDLAWRRAMDYAAAGMFTIEEVEKIDVVSLERGVIARGEDHE